MPSTGGKGIPGKVGLGEAAKLDAGLLSGNLLQADSFSATLNATYSIIKIPVITSDGPQKLVIQMGFVSSISTNGDTSYALTFPEAFANAFLYGSWTPHSGFTAYNIGAYVNGTGTAGMTLYADKDGNNNVTIGARWLAIGY